MERDEKSERLYEDDALEDQFRGRCAMVGWNPGPNADRETWAEWSSEVREMELREQQAEEDCEEYVRIQDYIARHHGQDFFDSLSAADQERLFRKVRGCVWNLPEDGSWILDFLKLK